ncbi:hypothetical protein [Adhaeribacter pallidiroseus]|uniref:Helicase XPB/Ssl2 N-terminal domain-containing protein n=1 Tax=Adhaeribacter pallidiroseus TaxID=2072847 RepID=A0A369QL30_9BACT|nr:hypothetical protein [Adhaeribacter pallidiroseus]RDC65633.1 hypothetical protein AHMF7616_04263 [Adhaeribacter pallidiroseus]
MQKIIPITGRTEMPDELSPRELQEVVSAAYTKDSIYPFFKIFLRSFILNNVTLCRQYHVPSYSQKPNPTKSELIACLVPFFQHGELFRQMRAALPDPMPAVVDKIIWEGGQNHESLEKHFNTKVAYTNQELETSYPNAVTELHPLFCLFRDDPTDRDYSYWYSGRNFKNETSYLHFLYFPRPLNARLKKFTPVPFGFDLIAISLPESPGLQVYTNHDSLFSELPVALSYVQQGKLSISESGLLNVASVSKMRKYCGIKEFYPDNGDKYAASIRTRFIAEMVLALNRKGFTTYDDSVAFLKQGFQLYEKAQFSSATVLFHLKGINKADTNPVVNQTLFSLLQQLPLGQWVAADNLLNYALYRELPLELIRDYVAHNNVYFESDDTYGKTKKYLYRPYYRTLLTEPLLRGTFYLFATFGLVDLAYGLPANPAAEKFKKKHISVFDGLQAVRLTALGAYLCGLTQTYEAPVTPHEKILLDEQHLFISYTGTNKPLLTILEKVARKAGEHLFKVDYETLLGDCNTSLEVTAKLNMFKQLLSATPPLIWQEFFAAIQERNVALPALNANYQLFELPSNKELIRLVASDAFLKKHIIKAEMYHVIIPKTSISKVKNYLKKFGFLIDFKEVS